jgi:hypothetical protein
VGADPGLPVLAAGSAWLPALQAVRFLSGLRPVRRPWMRVRVRGLTALRHHQPNAGLVVAEGPDSPDPERTDMSTRRHRVIQWAVVNGERGHLNISLTEAKVAVRSARRNADIFCSYECTDREGTLMHVAYARFLPGSPKHGFSTFNAELDVTYLFEVTAEAVIASFGLASTSDYAA